MYATLWNILKKFVYFSIHLQAAQFAIRSMKYVTGSTLTNPYALTHGGLRSYFTFRILLYVHEAINRNNACKFKLRG